MLSLVTANLTRRFGTRQRRCDKTRKIGGGMRRRGWPSTGPADQGVVTLDSCWRGMNQVLMRPGASQVHAEGRRRRLYEAWVFSAQTVCVAVPVLRCGVVTTMCDSCVPSAVRKSCCVIAGAASNAVAEVAAANQRKSRPVTSTDENATVSMFKGGFKLFLAVAFMICFLSVQVS